MNKEKFKLLCTQYFFHTINESGLAELRAALKSGDADLLKIYFKTKKGIENLPISVDLIEPPLEVKKNILNELRKGKQKKDYSPKDKYLITFNNVKDKIVMVAAVVFSISFIIVTYYSAVLLKDIHYLKGQIISVNNDLGKKNEILSILQSKQIDIINLKGQDINPSGYGKIIWSPVNNAAILQIGNLPPTTGKKKYRLWALSNNKDIDDGSFSVIKPDYENFFKLDSLSLNDINTNESFFLTLEPNGKGSKPTGTIYLMGSPND